MNRGWVFAYIVLKHISVGLINTDDNHNFTIYNLEIGGFF